MSIVGPENEDAQPSYLLSSERSGSNLLRSMLNTHTDISAPHPFETAYPMLDLPSPASLSEHKRRRLVRDILVNKRYSFHPLTVPLDPGRVADRVERDERSRLSIQRALYEETCAIESTSLWSSKYPGLWHLIDEAVDYYDDLRFIYLVRDPRDVVLSFKHSNIELYHPYFSAGRWREEQERGLELLQDRPDQVHLVRYKDVLQNPEDEIGQICDFLGLPFEDEMLYFYQTEEAKAASESSELLENLQMPIKRDNYDKYKNRLPDHEVKLTESIVGETMEAFEYDREYSPSDLENFEQSEEAVYDKLNRKLARKARLDHWWSAPREQVNRWLTTSFTAYMYLRYGVFA